MSSAIKVFDQELSLPDAGLAAVGRSLLGFEARYARIQAQLRLLLAGPELEAWNRKHHQGRLALCARIGDQYPLVILHGDVGTGKTATAAALADRVVREARAEDSILFKLSNRVRGSGHVGEMGSLLSEAFASVAEAAGKGRRAILIIDEGDSIGADRGQAHSHHEDKVAVNTIIQAIDDLRRHGGRVVVILCTNRFSVLDPALVRRAAVVEEFTRPDGQERRDLLRMDLEGLDLSEAQISQLVTATGAQGDRPNWTYSDIRTRLYPKALAEAFPDGPLRFEHLSRAAANLRPSPVMRDR
jgi:AAA+ superfamily predicted ATPase